MRFGGLTVTSLVVATVAIILTGGAGAAITTIGPWYWGLRKPSWNPPEWAFGPAWTTIYAFTASAAVIAWNSASATTAERVRLLSALALNILLNIAWSALFFRFRRPDWALIEVAALWLSILALVLVARPMSRAASWLFVPYLAWVSFASVLNQRIVALNRPFPHS
ncbi:MAG: TspO/MBR family protein [Gemmatimonadota bacterium]